MIKRIALLLLATYSCLGAGGIVTPTISGGGGSGGGAATNLTPWTSQINAAGNNLINGGTFHANFFIGDGSQLTGIVASNVIAAINGTGTNTTFVGTVTFVGDTNVTIQATGGGSFIFSNSITHSVVVFDRNGQLAASSISNGVVSVIHANGITTNFFGNSRAARKLAMEQAAAIADWGSVIKIGPGLYEVDNFEVPGVSVVGSGRGITFITNSVASDDAVFFICTSNFFSDFTLGANVNPFDAGENATFAPPYFGGVLERLDVFGQIDGIQSINGAWTDGLIKNCTWTGNWDLMRFNSASRVTVSDCVFNLIGTSNPNLRGITFPTGSTGMVQNCTFNFSKNIPASDTFAISIDNGIVQNCSVTDAGTNTHSLNWFVVTANTTVLGAQVPVSKIVGTPVYSGQLLTTNVVSLTNSAPSHVVLIGESDYSTNATFTLTSVSGITDAVYNYGVLHVHNTLGSLIQITPPASWGPTSGSTNGTWNCTNDTIISVVVVPGRSTNAICYPQH